MRGPVIAEVTASKSGKYEVGCFVYAAAGWTEQAIVDESDKVLQKLDVAKGGRLSDGLGVFGESIFMY